MMRLVLRPALVVFGVCLLLVSVTLGIGRTLSASLLMYRSAETVYIVDVDRLLNIAIMREFVGADPQLSPDGSQLIFAQVVAGDNYIYTANVASPHDARNITPNFPNSYSPVWSPDGRRIAFTHGFNGGADIYVMNADGSNIRRLTNIGGCHRAAWSSNSARIVFHCFSQVYLLDMSRAGALPRRLTPDNIDGRTPAFSPDGLNVVFVGITAGHAGIYVTNLLDNSNRVLRDNLTDPHAPLWSSDRITFIENWGSNRWRLYTMDTDGGNLRLITENSALEVIGWLTP